MTEIPDSFVAVLPPGNHSRAIWWAEMFGSRAVPVKSDEPALTIFPGGDKEFCYFVDFDSCDWLKPRLLACLERHNKQGERAAAVRLMLEEDIYPLVADGITVVRAPRRIWDRPAE